MARIRVVIPNSAMPADTLRARERMLSALLPPGTELSVACIAAGPPAVETHRDEVEAIPYVVAEVEKAGAAGCDAAVIYCTSDPGLEAARQAVPIPVIGAGQAGWLLAVLRGGRIGVVTPGRRTLAEFRRLASRSGIDPRRVAAVRSLELPVLALDPERPDQLRPRLLALCQELVEEVDVVFLACAGLAGQGRWLQAQLGIPVVDPAFASVALAEMVLRLGPGGRRGQV